MHKLPMPNQSSPVPPGTLEMLILRTLDLEPMHGYAIAQHIHRLSKDALKIEEGSLYPALYRMERKGWIEAEWGESELGRKAKLYQLTTAGRKQLRAETEEWARFAGAVSRILLPA